MALLSAVPLAGCSGGAAVPDAPVPPAAVLEQPERQYWGDAVAVQMGRMAGRVHDRLYERHGRSRERERERGQLGRDPAAVAGLEGWYAARLTGWKRVSLSLPPGEHGFAFENGDGRKGGRALALAWLDPMPDGRVPAVTMRYGPD